MGARYYPATAMRFLSQDPAFLAVGNPKALKSITGGKQRTYLADPQNMSSYGYARNNPLVNKDPDGNFSIGFSLNGTVEGGFDAYAARYASKNYNLVVDPATWQAHFVESTSGAIASGRMLDNQSESDSGGGSFVYGVYGGGGLSWSYSNLTNPNDIQGTQNSVNVNAPLSLSVQGGQTQNPTYSFGFGTKGIASVSKYPVNTQITRIHSVNQYVNNAASKVSDSFQSAISGIQAQLKAILGKINELKESISKIKN
jgi:RHS repeat-associated protein